MNNQVALPVSFFISLLVFSLFFELITPQEKKDTSTVNSHETIIESNMKPSIKDGITENNFSLPIEEEIQKCREFVIGFNSEALAKKQQCRESIENKHKMLKEQEVIMSSLAKKVSEDNWELNKSSSSKVEKSSIAIIEAFKNAQYFIVLIYILLLITLWIQVFIAFSIKEKIDEKTFSMSEWAISSPPILGVVGTIYSFASFTLVASEQKGLFDIFKSNFYDAAATTVIGGSFYVINLAISIWIASKLSKNSE